MCNNSWLGWIIPSPNPNVRRDLWFFTSPELSVSADLFCVPLISSCSWSPQAHFQIFPSILMLPASLPHSSVPANDPASNFREKNRGHHVLLSEFLPDSLPCFKLFWTSVTSFFPSSDQVGGNATLCNRACERLKRNSEIAFRMIKFEVSLGYPKKSVEWQWDRWGSGKRFSLEIAKHRFTYCSNATSSTKPILAKQNCPWIHETHCLSHVSYHVFLSFLCALLHWDKNCFPVGNTFTLLHMLTM